MSPDRMQWLVRRRLLALLGPLWLLVLGLVCAAVWVGYSWAVQMGPELSPWWTTKPLWALGTACLLVVLWVLVCGAAYQLFAPWVKLAKKIQSRSLKDTKAIDIEKNAPAEMQAMVLALNHWLARADAENLAQQRFIADAAHQLRTPLAALQSQVEAWALMALTAPDQCIVLPAQQVERLRHASRRTTQLAKQLLALSHVESGQGALVATERVDIQSLCEALFEVFLEAALAKQLDWGLEAQAAHVTGQAWMLREMVSNILDNAIKYTPSGGRVTLRCGRRDAEGGQSRVYVEVEDDGPGVSVGEYTRLTQRFYRVPGGSADGSGLGLAIVAEIAQTHGAHLSFKPGYARRGLCVSLLFKE